MSKSNTRLTGWIASRFIKLSLISAIKAYQKFISPHKGYCCAHAQIYDGLSCSNYALSVIREKGVFQGVILSVERLKACAATPKTALSTNSTDSVNQAAWAICIPICIPYGCDSKITAINKPSTGFESAIPNRNSTESQAIQD